MRKAELTDVKVIKYNFPHAINGTRGCVGVVVSDGCLEVDCQIRSQVLPELTDLERRLVSSKVIPGLMVVKYQ